MVSLRCKMLVKATLNDLGIFYTNIDLGEVDLEADITEAQRDNLKANLLAAGLVLMDDQKAILVEKIKAVVIEMVHYADEFPAVKHSVYISEKLNYNYTYLANLFSEVKGITLEQYIILHKIEKVKELILYDELNLSEIAFKLNYSSSAHLSNQFKKITGLTPSFFKKLKQKRQKPLEDL
ncbi:helix-turn-helix transcriptional regulator [Ilyomonas limi]|uniref:Helix-turn-helix transcriptional regulator n=1 Tax=Ilyomonas limi TaxID=2575867 RepID=A0A4U3KQE1_9BACT|nr:AraC family transcriptional regulator [Ilyomonas limi]TKK64545.1 helix-turn-helix transcriptional regulator [Ilyomonas limi]